MWLEYLGCELIRSQQIELNGGVMKITEVRIFPKAEEKLKAYAAITFDSVFVVHNLSIVKGEKG